MRRAVRALIVAAPLTVLAVPSAAQLVLADGPQAQTYHVTLDPLNSSGASGVANLRLVGDQLTVTLNAHGLLPSAMHMQHLHWGAAAAHTCPPASAAGSDGILTVAEGAPFYGPVDVPLTLPGSTDYPTADASGTIHYQRTFTLTSLQLSHVADWVVVEHGLDENHDGMLMTQQEMFDPVTCGTVDATHGNAGS